MTVPSIILIVTALSMGVLEISLSTGKTLSRIRFNQSVKVALALIILHIPVLIVGWYSGEKLEDLLTRYESWIALAILALLGLKMIIESLVRKNKLRSVSLIVLLGMILAALFDALIIGISLALLNLNILTVAMISGVVLFFATTLGILRGRSLIGKRLYYIKAWGGVMLFLLGIINLIGFGPDF
ncbi:manganese efflux pump MntP [Maribellus maritimus]|uniref:manganese efflux pump MntP n=1 Tax=Maribellus maritimus TaxID=2870838 RepID=UPI001EEAB785|nr:manganese efflux pump [Maribellus maritimus]MCG6188465.1 manganese efflux pump MntP family protein [Maribellus maritimus]